MYPHALTKQMLSPPSVRFRGGVSAGRYYYMQHDYINRYFYFVLVIVAVDQQRKQSNKINNQLILALPQPCRGSDIGAAVTRVTHWWR